MVYHMKNEFKYIISLVMILSAVMVMVSGGTFAYYSWQGSDEQRTEVVFTVEQEFSCAADGGGNITHEDVPIAPASCINSKHAIKREVKVKPTITGGHTVLMNLWLDINEIGTGLSNSRNFRYALTTDPNSCTNGIVETGNFYGTQAGDEALILNRTGYTSTTVETYYLYIWLDSKETSPDTMLQEFDFSINGMCTNAPEPDSYFVFNQTDESLRLYKSDPKTSLHSDDDYSVSFLDNSDDESESQGITGLVNLEEIYYWSADQLPWYEYRNDIKSVVVEDEISPVSTMFWFSDFVNVESIDLTKLNTSKVTRMNQMFSRAGYNVNTFEIIGLDYFDTARVLVMAGMFAYAGYSATTWNIGDLSNWDVSNVESFVNMFSKAGYSASTWDIGDLSNWDTSNLLYILEMFASAGYNASVFNIGNIGNWDVSKVTSMMGVFSNTGYSATTWNIGDLSNWDTSNVTDMNWMFDNAGRNAPIWDVGDLSNWDTSNVTGMIRMFASAGQNSSIFDIGNLSNWDTSNVTNMAEMFHYAGRNATTWNIGDLSNWDVSNVTNMAGMFQNSGRNSSIFDIGNLDNWNVSNVTNMRGMFGNAGRNSSIFDIGNLSNWNTSNVTDMYAMLSEAGVNAEYSLDLSGWNVNNVTSYTYFNSYVESKITPPVWVN